LEGYWGDFSDLLKSNGKTGSTGKDNDEKEKNIFTLSVSEEDGIPEPVFPGAVYLLGTVVLYYLMFGSFKMTKPAWKNH
jgi:hypothetical protein